MSAFDGVSGTCAGNGSVVTAVTPACAKFVECGQECRRRRLARVKKRRKKDWKT